MNYSMLVAMAVLLVISAPVVLILAHREGKRRRSRRPMIGLATLFAQAKAAFDALTPDEQIHHRHEQRISFVVGNVGLSRPDMSRADLEAGARRAAGPCPCARCSTRGEPYR